MFATAGDGQVFVGVVSDQQWAAFCAAFAFDDFASDATLAFNNDRVLARDRILPRICALFATLDSEELLAKCEAIGLPVAPIARPEDLFDDPHLNARGGLVDLQLPNGTAARLPALPIEVDGARFGVRHDLGEPGAHSRALLLDAGLTAATVDALFASGAAG